ncbi:hypothetical protein TNCV_328271 [Trichonephila clavipes]|nr:hypothetical protein TNCV_328271 [Trichonephila clavipes]
MSSKAGVTKDPLCRGADEHLKFRGLEKNHLSPILDDCCTPSDRGAATIQNRVPKTWFVHHPNIQKFSVCFNSGLYEGQSSRFTLLTSH